MKVIAKEVGFYGQLRKPGDIFEIKNKKALGKWMTEVRNKAEIKTKVETKA